MFSTIWFVSNATVIFCVSIKEKWNGRLKAQKVPIAKIQFKVTKKEIKDRKEPEEDDTRKWMNKQRLLFCYYSFIMNALKGHQVAGISSS